LCASLAVTSNNSVWWNGLHQTAALLWRQLSCTGCRS